MKTTSKRHRTLQALFAAGISISALATAHAADAPEVTANNYVRAKSDIQMIGYIEILDGSWTFPSPQAVE